jgi:hypothetical protein
MYYDGFCNPMGMKTLRKAISWCPVTHRFRIH